MEISPAYAATAAHSGGVIRVGKFISSGDVTSDKAIQGAIDAIPDLTAIEGIRQLSPVALTDGVVKRLVHGLGRKYRGFILVGLSAAATVTDDQTKTDTDTYLYLTPHGASPTVRVLVY